MNEMIKPTRVSAKVIKLIIDEEEFDLQITAVCAEHVKAGIDRIIKSTKDRGKSGNWCTLEEWNKRLEELESTSTILGKLMEFEPI